MKFFSSCFGKDCSSMNSKLLSKCLLAPFSGKAWLGDERYFPFCDQTSDHASI